jgi:hypothetical protein
MGGFSAAVDSFKNDEDPGIGHVHTRYVIGVKSVLRG